MNTLNSHPISSQGVSSEQFGHPALNAAITTAWLLRNGIAPLRELEDGALEVLAVDASNHLALDVLAATVNRPVVVLPGDADAVRRCLMARATVRRESVADLVRDGVADATAGAPDDARSVSMRTGAANGELLGGDPEHPTVIRLVNAILAEAVEIGASDIHLEPDAAGLKVRFRIDGMLEDRQRIPAAFREPAVSRIKVMSRLDVSNRLHPQDGAFDVTFGGRPVDVRVSTIPTPAGQRVVMRLLDRSGQAVTPESLGMMPALIAAIDGVLNRPQGLFLVAGPTGSGKTTTLYACLNRLDVAVRNTITIEDPVEYHVPGISQIQVGRDRNLGFADGLRSILRQDPDVIMVGEIRDGDTASTALQAALTGHLILSTLHTTDPASAIIRLLDLGVEPPLIAETLSAVMDQRLVRTVCSACNGSPGGTPDITENGIPNRTSSKSGDFHSAGPAASAATCPKCRGTGFHGRTGLFRFLAADSELRRAIRSSDHQAIRDMVDASCGNDLMTQAAALVEAGRTTRAEIQRVIQTGGAGS